MKNELFIVINNTGQSLCWLGGPGEAPLPTGGKERRVRLQIMSVLAKYIIQLLLYCVYTDMAQHDTIQHGPS